MTLHRILSAGWFAGHDGGTSASSITISKLENAVEAVPIYEASQYDMSLGDVKDALVWGEPMGEKHRCCCGARAIAVGKLYRYMHHVIVPPLRTLSDCGCWSSSTCF